MVDRMKYIKNWSEFAKGMYRFEISENTFYEIHILHLGKDRDVLDAIANLYFAGEYSETDGYSYFGRDCLSSGYTVSECIESAVRDYKENEKDKESEE